MPRADTETILGIEKTEGFEYGIVVLERFSLTHGDDIGDSHTEIVLNDEYLLNLLSGGKVPGEAFGTSRAEDAPHAATNLSGKANRQMLGKPLVVDIARGNTNRLNSGAIIVFEDVLSRSIGRYASIDDLRTNQGILDDELFPELRRKVAHLVVSAGTSLVEPSDQLFCTETRLPEFTADTFDG